MNVANDSPMVLSNRLGGVKDALLLIAKSYETQVVKSRASLAPTGSRTTWTIEQNTKPVGAELA
ncbi:hypothetical protein, partial [Pseudomonas fluorescens]|uniref:hypothetical protein n=1 Tax=Pseudomonas fluorescens TaxID=294 RepID=UPI001BEADC31